MVLTGKLSSNPVRVQRTARSAIVRISASTIKLSVRCVPSDCAGSATAASARRQRTCPPPGARQQRDRRGAARSLGQLAARRERTARFLSARLPRPSSKRAGQLPAIDPRDRSDQRPRIRMHRCAPNLPRGTVGDNLAGIHHHNPRADPRHRTQVVADIHPWSAPAPPPARAAVPAPGPAS